MHGDPALLPRKGVQQPSTFRCISKPVVQESWLLRRFDDDHDDVDDDDEWIVERVINSPQTRYRSAKQVGL